MAFLEKGGQTFVTSNSRYLPVFNDYLTEKDLEDKVSFDCKPEGPEHLKRWKASILCE